jgi:CubicO group peptidase (beta-lactamase class C family)
MQRRQDSLNTTTPSSTRFPSAQYGDQDQAFAGAFQILDEAVTQRVFPGASVAITYAGKLVALKAVGHFTYEARSPQVTVDSIFDLASVTKVVATTSMAMILYERGLLDLDAPLVGVLPEFAAEDQLRRTVTFRMLLAHSSGLPGHEKFYLSAHKRDELIGDALRALSLALERLAEETLDAFCQREVFGPLGMLQTTFNPPAALKSRIPPTANDQTFRMRIIQGEVYDENASVMGGVAPHAGLFSTAFDVATFAHALLNGGAPIARPETVALFRRRETSPLATSRALGWDTPSSPSQSGKYFSAASFGHLGYTGTSLWIDPERQLSVTVLTNRTWPDCSNHAIKAVRPRFHDAVVEALRVAG